MKQQSSNTKKPSGTSDSKSNVSAIDYLGNATPRGKPPSIIANEPETYDAALQWLRARVSRTSSISFRQFYDEYLVPVLKTKYSHKGILETIKARHAEEYGQIN